MNSARHPSDSAEAARELGRLREEIRRAHLELAGLRPKIASARTRLGASKASRLLEANEHLILAALAAQRAAEASAQALAAIAEAAEVDPLTGLPTAAVLRARMRQPAIPLPPAASAGEHVVLQEANTQLLLAAINAQALQGAAEQAQRRQSTFLGVLAHELRNPLTPISNAASILGRLPSEGPMLPKVQQIIERQVKIMSRLVEDLFDLIRVNAGKLRLDKEWVDMRSLVEQVVQTSRPAMETRLQRFEVELPPPGTTVHGDPVRLTQVLVNLLSNSAKYTPERGDIRLSAEVAGDTLVLRVTDNGIGIRPEALSSIFDPFTQEHHATVFNGDGLGIGLAVVRELVQGHGGSVSARSAGIGLGSEFTVTLPMGLEAGGSG